MKSRYKREAYYLDEDVLLHGYKDKRGFHPDFGLECGFDLQKLNKKANNKVVFRKLSKAVKRLDEITVCGGILTVGVHNGAAMTKLICKMSDVIVFHISEIPVNDENLEAVISDSLKKEKITLVGKTVVRVAYF